ncbi:hypothetical protein, partial [Phascolarctobacterium faecium]|uniref:hypothetical protein n=1 Tax=Phascolarctobacterium faecium TaxID=33025 RepID=UPI003FD6FB67
NDPFATAADKGSFFEILNVTVIKIIRIIKKCLIVIKISCKVQRKYVNIAKIIHINNIKY